MRLWYPPNDKPIFSCSAVSMQKYDWSKKSVPAKTFINVLTYAYLVVFIYIFLCMNFHHLITWADLTGRPLWAIIGGILILALFPAIVLPLIFSLKSQTRFEPEHAFYRDWANVFTGYGKGQRQCFFAEDIESVRMQRTFYEERTLFLLTIRFKSWGFGRRGKVSIAIRADKEDEVRPLEDWMRDNQIMTTWDLPLENQRRS